MFGDHQRRGGPFLRHAGVGSERGHHDARRTGQGRNAHPVQQAWIEEQVPQCGFCQNGQIITAKVLLDRNPNPTDQQIRDGMAGALCRCMTYYRVQAAIKAAASVRGRRTSLPAVAQSAKAEEERMTSLTKYRDGLS